MHRSNERMELRRDVRRARERLYDDGARVLRRERGLARHDKGSRREEDADRRDYVQADGRADAERQISPVLAFGGERSFAQPMNLLRWIEDTCASDADPPSAASAC
jgi:hypothetical protein